MTETPLTGDYFQDMVLDQFLKCPGAKIHHFWIAGNPYPNERPRIISRGGKSWAFTPSQTIKARQNILNQVLVQKKFHVEPPYSVAIKFIFNTQLTPDYKESDIDNYCKLLFDAIFSNKKAIPPMPFKDDKHIKNLVCFKRVGLKPGIHLWVMTA